MQSPLLASIGPWLSQDTCIKIYWIFRANRDCQRNRAEYTLSQFGTICSQKPTSTTPLPNMKYELSKYVDLCTVIKSAINQPHSTLKKFGKALYISFLYLDCSNLEIFSSIVPRYIHLLIKQNYEIPFFCSLGVRRCWCVSGIIYFWCE